MFGCLYFTDNQLIYLKNFNDFVLLFVHKAQYSIKKKKKNVSLVC